MRKKLHLFVFLFALTVLVLSLAACSGGAQASLSVRADRLGTEISNDLYGLFLEDISYACDGGLVSNLVYNNSFEYAENPLAGWTHTGVTLGVQSDNGLNESNPSSLEVRAGGEGTLTNLGYVEYYDYLTYDYNAEKMRTADMGFAKDAVYRLYFYVKNADFSGSLSVKLDSPSNGDAVSISLPAASEDWTLVAVNLTSKETEDGGLTLSFSGSGTLYLDFFVLESTASYGYGTEEWQYVSLRNDLYQALDDLSPAFVRFPGGCLAEGDSLAHLFDWKQTLGPLETRLQHYNIWHDDENGKTYNNTFAMGYHEYFQLSADLGAEPLPILNVGMICQFEAKYNANAKAYAKGKMTTAAWEAYLDTVALRPGTPAFDAYIQDVFDLIEYANGDETTVWGAQRIANGRTEPFDLKYVGLGNENWGELYWRNFDALYNALKEKHPEITVISSAGYQFSGERYEDSWQIINEKYTDTLVDEHYYTKKNTLFKNNDRYDHYSRDGAPVFVGEYAATSWGFGKLITKNNIWAAIEEASYLTGIERNGDLVKMAAYAPTFAKVNAQCWEINLIWFDSQGIVLTPNYYTQLLFANNVGTRVVDTDFSRKNCYTVTTVDEEEQVLYIKIVNAGKKAFDLSLQIDGFGALNAASVQYISNASQAACNEPGVTTVLPQEKDCSVNESEISVPVEGYSVNVVRVYYGGNNGENAYRLPHVPVNMESDVSAYTKPYLTAGEIAALITAGGVVVLGLLAWLAVVLLKKFLKKRKAAL